MLDMDIGVIGSHVAKQTAALAMEGEFTNARMVTLQAQRMIHEQRYVFASQYLYYLCIYVQQRLHVAIHMYLVVSACIFVYNYMIKQYLFSALLVVNSVQTLQNSYCQGFCIELLFSQGFVFYTYYDIHAKFSS